MNELMAVISTEDWLYWKTEEIKAWNAWDEMLRNMETIGINVDNFCPRELKLRNENGEDIDSWEI